MEQYISEIIIGVFLAIFGWAFRSWASTVKDSTTEVLARITSLAREFHQHTMKTENRVATVEEKVKNIEKRIDTK